MTEHARYVATPTGFLMVLRQGDDVLGHLETLMRSERIASASISGFGFAGRTRFGFFDFDRGEYEPKDFFDLEIAALIGTLAWSGSDPAIHAHASGTDRSFHAVGGHLLVLTVGRGSFEIAVNTIPLRLERSIEPDLGAKVLQLPASGSDLDGTSTKA